MEVPSCAPATMSETPASGTRIVPIISSRKSSPRSARNASNSIRRRNSKTDMFDPEALRLDCLEKLNLYAAPIRGDGNCLFYCFSDQLHGTTEYHKDIRDRVVNHMREHKDYFLSFIPDVGGERRAPRRAVAEQAKKASTSVDRAASRQGQEQKFEKMLSNMSKEGCWGGSTEIQAFCQAYGLDVNVYSESGIRKFTSAPTEGGQVRGVVHVAYHSFQHYSSIRNVDGPHTGLPNITKQPDVGVTNSMNFNGENKETNSFLQEDATLSSFSDSSPARVTPRMIKSISEALPGYSHGAIKAALIRCRGDIDNASAQLLDSDPSEFDSSSSSDSTSSNSANVLERRGLMPTAVHSARVGLGSSSRSSSRHSTASKRSAEDSDEDGIRPPIRRRGRDNKRRILQDVTVGIAAGEEDKHDLLPIRL